MSASRRWLLAGAVFACFVGLVFYASLPTGADRAADAVPEGARLVHDVAVEDVVVQLVSEGGSLRIQVAYPSSKGWLAVALDDQPGDVSAAVSSTPGGGPLPEFTAVYGRVEGDAVDIDWEDGDTSTLTPESDGAYLVARVGRIGVARVTVRSAGATVAEVDDL